VAADNLKFIDPVEDFPWRSPREIFASLRYAPLAPSELEDQQVPGRLWELLYAAAARRFYFDSTNHLSDRELYNLLWEQWLDKPTPDLPPEAETNTRIAIAEFTAGKITHKEIWLRYYANADDRQLWQSTDPHFVLPSHEDPPYDRDRFLPVPPIPLEAHASWPPGDDDPPQDEETDPGGLAGIDEDIGGTENETTAEVSPFDVPDSSFEAQLNACEPENWTPPAQQLAEENVPLLPPDEITDQTIAPILWELMHNLALRSFYLSHTDHLSDRALYAELWHHGLREPAQLFPRNPRGGWFHDFLGSWGEEEVQLWLRYYATDEERAKHAAEWPKHTLPPKEKPSFNRDWRLPKGPF
jgi:hypothetical protein